MSKLQLLGAGFVGTPQTQDIINALVMQSQALSGQRTLVLTAVPAAAASSAAVVTAAAVGTIKKTIVLTFADAAGNVHTWINGSPVTLTPTEVVTDVDVAAPALDDTTPLFTNGVATVVATYDTNAGATKGYVSGDKVGFTAACAAIAGLTATETNADFLDTMVA